MKKEFLLIIFSMYTLNFANCEMFRQKQVTKNSPCTNIVQVFPIETPSTVGNWFKMSSFIWPNLQESEP